MGGTFIPTGSTQNSQVHTKNKKLNKIDTVVFSSLRIKGLFMDRVSFMDFLFLAANITKTQEW